MQILREIYDISDTPCKSKMFWNWWCNPRSRIRTYFLNINMFPKDHYLLEYQDSSLTRYTGHFFNKRALLDRATEGLIQWKGLWAGRENSRAAQPEQACDITKPFPGDPWPPGPLDRRGAQRRPPILHYTPTADQKPLTLSVTKGWTPD